MLTRYENETLSSSKLLQRINLFAGMYTRMLVSLGESLVKSMQLC